MFNEEVIETVLSDLDSLKKSYDDAIKDLYGAGLEQYKILHEKSPELSEEIFNYISLNIFFTHKFPDNKYDLLSMVLYEVSIFMRKINMPSDKIFSSFSLWGYVLSLYAEAYESGKTIDYPIGYPDSFENKLEIF